MREIETQFKADLSAAGFRVLEGSTQPEGKGPRAPGQNGDRYGRASCRTRRGEGRVVENGERNGPVRDPRGQGPGDKSCDWGMTVGLSCRSNQGAYPSLFRIPPAF